MHDDSELDERLERALDAALATYREAEPSPDLPLRILDHVANETRQDARKGPRTGRPARHVAAWAWAAALATAAILLVTVVLAHRFAVAPLPLIVARLPHSAALHAPPAPAGEAHRAFAALSGRQPASSPRSRTAAPRLLKTVQTLLTGPRPLPAPYSPEELVLVAFVEQHPKEAREAQEAARCDAEPLHEEPLVTPPVQIDPIAPDTIN